MVGVGGDVGSIHLQCGSLLDVPTLFHLQVCYLNRMNLLRSSVQGMIETTFRKWYLLIPKHDNLVHTFNRNRPSL